MTICEKIDVIHTDGQITNVSLFMTLFTSFDMSTPLDLTEAPVKMSVDWAIDVDKCQAVR